MTEVPTTDARTIVLDRLVELLQAHPACAGDPSSDPIVATQVADEYPGDLLVDREAIWCDDIEGVETRIVASVAGRHARDDIFNLKFMFWVAWRGTSRATKARTTALVAALEDVCADGPQLGIPEVVVRAEVTNKNGPRTFDTGLDAFVGGAEATVEVHTRLV